MNCVIVEMSDIKTSEYVLDASDRIISVSPQWDQFAIENDTPGAMAENVIGRQVWDFVEGLETASYLNAIFFACRMDTESFDILYRCDAPEIKRMFRMSVHPEEKGVLTLRHDLLHSKSRLHTNKVEVFTDHYDSTRCSVCCSFLIGENWIDVFPYLNDRYFPKSYSVCPACRELAQKGIDQMTHRNGSTKVVRFPSSSN